MGHFRQNFKIVENCGNYPTIVSGFFKAILSNSSSFDETAAKKVFKVAEFESIVKIELRPFLGALGPIFAENLGLTRELLGVRTR